MPRRKVKQEQRSQKQQDQDETFFQELTRTGNENQQDTKEDIEMDEDVERWNKEWVILCLTY